MRGKTQKTGLSHNKKSNTYITPPRYANLRIPQNKKNNKLESYFKRTAPNPPSVVDLAIEEPSTSG